MQRKMPPRKTHPTRDRKGPRTELHSVVADSRGGCACGHGSRASAGFCGTSGVAPGEEQRMGAGPQCALPCAVAGTARWRDAIAKETRKVKPAFELAELDCEAAKHGNALPGFQEIRCHVVFDIKMDFTFKARFAAGGHTTEMPAGMTRSSVVSRPACCGQSSFCAL
jgi:hypothetical protein